MKNDSIDIEFAIDYSGIVFLFKELLGLKMKVDSAKTLLVSATPNPFFVNFLGIDKKNIVSMDTFNNKNYIFNFIDNKIHPMTNEIKENGIFVFNTAFNSQKSSKYAIENHNEKTINYHSKFTPHDKKNIIKEILKNFGKGRFGSNNKTLRAGPIVQASLNITTDNMFTEICSAENWCQRLGRLNRFGEDLFDFSVMNTYYDLVEGEINTIEGQNTFLNNLGQKQQTLSWLNFIKERI